MKDFRLLTPVTIGPVELRNRIMFPSMCLNFAGPDGEIPDNMIAFYENRAKAGVGSFVIPANHYGPNKGARGSLNDDSRIPQWKPLLDALHAQGAKVFCQIHPTGVQFGRVGHCNPAFTMSTEELRALIEVYAEGALRARKAGFDGVEIHGAHGHEVALLLSQALNTRTDCYGGSLENCARAIAEMIMGMKRLCGPEYPVIMRLSGEERIPGGRELPESLAICKLLQQAGADAIHVSAGMPASEEWERAPSEVEQGHLAFMGKCLKENLDIPVIVVGRVVDWQVGERMLENGEADVVAVGRAMLAEPLWAAGVGRDGPPRRKCIACNQGCCNQKDRTICLQNPILGREERIRITKDPGSKKICVIGGGVSGLEAAHVFARRGHAVTVFERENRLGGLFYWAAKTPGKTPFLNVIDFYERALPLLGVKIELNAALTEAPAGDWDLVVSAVGGNPVRPPIQIVDAEVVDAVDFLASGPLKADNYVVVGDGMVGYEIADYILANGKRPVLVGNDPRDPAGVQGVARWNFMKARFGKAKLESIRHSTVTRIDADGLSITDKDGGERRINGKYTYVMACGYNPASDESLRRFAGRGAPVLAVGNAAFAGDALAAVRDAFDKALTYDFART